MKSTRSLWGACGDVEPARYAKRAENIAKAGGLDVFANDRFLTHDGIVNPQMSG